MWWIVLGAIGLGFAYAAVPGAVNTEAARRGLRGGFRPAALVQLGALSGGLFWALIALAGLSVVFHHSFVEIGLGLLGAAFLFALARAAFVGAFRAEETIRETSSNRGNLVTGMIFSLANPAGIAFWAGVGSGVIGASPRLAQATAFLVAFGIGAAGWGVSMAILLAGGRRYAGDRVVRAVNVISGALLALFGVRLLLGAIQRLASWLPWMRPIWTMTKSI